MKPGVVFFACFAALVMFQGLGTGTLPLIDRDEPRFAEASREMIERGDWIVPYFNDAPRLHKPPLFYWAQILSYQLLGEDELGARLPSVLAAILVSALVVNVLKLVLQLPRPTPRSGYGFPSGDSGAAFSFAAVIATALPTLAPLVFSLATLDAVSRLYFRAHYVFDVLGGAVIGIVCGSYFARRMLHKQSARPVSWSARATWVGIGVLTLTTGAFFFVWKATSHGTGPLTISPFRQPRQPLKLISAPIPPALFS